MPPVFLLGAEYYLLHRIRGIEKAFDLFQRKSRLLIKTNEPDKLLLQLTVEQMPAFVFSGRGYQSYFFIALNGPPGKF